MPEIYLSMKIEGVEVSDLIESLILEESDTRADIATVIFGNSSLVLADILHEGLSVEIDLGRMEAHALLFKGVVTDISSEFPTRGEPQIELKAADNLILLSLRPRTKRWWNTTISQIIRDIALTNELVPGEIQIEEDPTIEESRALQQVEDTDLAFLYRLARDCDCKLFLEHDEGTDRLNFVSTRSLLEADPIERALTFNVNLQQFSGNFRASSTNPQERLVTTDPLSGESVEVGGEELVEIGEEQWTPDPDLMARLEPGAVARITTLLARTQSRRTRIRDYWRFAGRRTGAPSRPTTDRTGTRGDRARRLGQTGRGRASGMICLRPRRRVCILGTSGRWSGEWYMAQVRHEINLTEQRYTSSFVCTR